MVDRQLTRRVDPAAVPSTFGSRTSTNYEFRNSYYGRVQTLGASPTRAQFYGQRGITRVTSRPRRTETPRHARRGRLDTTVLAEIADFVRPWRTANTNGSRTP